MKNNITDVKSQYGRRTVDLTVFHGSHRLFAHFEFDRNPKARSSPGIWFAADEGYSDAHGQFIYECRIRTDAARWTDDFHIMTIDEARLAGVDCQVAIHGEGIDDAIITCNDLSRIEIVRVFDPDLEAYVEFSEIENRMVEIASMTSRPSAPCLPGM